MSLEQEVALVSTEAGRIKIITEELEKLENHIKTYSTGAYPCFYLQLHSALKVQDILEMTLSSVYWCDQGNIRVKTNIMVQGVQVILNENERLSLAWYALQRIPVIRTNQSVLQDYLSVNKQGKPLQKQVYRKMLERMSSELGLSRIYNAGYIRSLYGYLQICHGQKTIEEMAAEYGVTKYYLINRMFKSLPIEYAEDVLHQVACIKKIGEGENDDISDRYG